MGRILAVGNATLDIVNVVEKYPQEDDEIRALSQHFRRGGNACNTLVVLSQLGHRCSWAGTLADESDAAYILADLDEHNIDYSAIHSTPGGKVPTSYIILSRQTASRTIVHHRDLPEYAYRDFSRIDLEGVDWLHFEGRNVEQLARMMAAARKRRPDLPISLEVEKPRHDIEALFPYADLLLFSRAYAQHRGSRSAEAFLRHMANEGLKAQLTCTWGEAGAWGIDRSANLLHAPAFKPHMVVDTLGAGDTFNAGMINELLAGEPLEVALIEASRLAGKKCGHYGFNSLHE